MRRIRLGCCARAASGHAAAAPPSSVMNWRRLGSSMGSSPEPAVPAGLSLGIVRSHVHEHADAPHALGLLRSRHERPHDRRAAEERDERAPFPLM